MKAIQTWILIANGAHARILLNEGVGKSVTALPEMVFDQAALKQGDIMADRPGRSFDSGGAGRHSMAYHSEPVRAREKKFASMLSSTLSQAHAEGAFDRLILVAPPQALGDLRMSLPLDLKRVLGGTLAKDLTHTPNSEISKHLSDLAAV